MALTVNRMEAKSTGGSLPGGEDLSEVWIRRGLDPLPHLRGALASRDIREFFAGCRYLERVGEAAIEFLPLLVDAVTDENPEIQVAAIGRLGHLGQHAASSAAVLEKALLDDDPRVRAAAEEALPAIR